VYAHNIEERMKYGYQGLSLRAFTPLPGQWEGHLAYKNLHTTGSKGSFLGDLA